MPINEWGRMRTWKRYLYAVATGAMLMLAAMLATGHAKADPTDPYDPANWPCGWSVGATHTNTPFRFKQCPPGTPPPQDAPTVAPVPGWVIIP